MKYEKILDMKLVDELWNEKRLGLERFLKFNSKLKLIEKSIDDMMVKLDNIFTAYDNGKYRREDTGLDTKDDILNMVKYIAIEYALDYDSFGIGSNIETICNYLYLDDNCISFMEDERLMAGLMDMIINKYDTDIDIESDICNIWKELFNDYGISDILLAFSNDNLDKFIKENLSNMPAISNSKIIIELMDEVEFVDNLHRAAEASIGVVVGDTMRYIIKNICHILDMDNNGFKNVWYEFLNNTYVIDDDDAYNKI